MFLTIGQTISGRYEIKDKLGSGGMANVYKALDTKLDREVTFKVLREEYVKDDDFIRRFYVEARAAARLSHHNIVNVHDVDQDGDIYYIVMEYIDGFTLKELILQQDPISDTEILGVVIQIASALEHSHSHNIIHRDIKPQNILLTTNGKVKVTDFGIARASSTSTVTTTNNTMGSAHYFSPEQARGRFVDARSDIYSLGIVMYEMAAKTLPFDGDTAVTVALKHLNDPMPDIRQYNPDINESLEKIIFKATEKISSNRYESVESMSNDLKRALTNSSGDFVQSNYSDSNNTIVFSDDEVSMLDLYDGSLTDLQSSSYEDYHERLDKHLSEKKAKTLTENRDYVDANTEKKVVIAAIISAFVVISIVASIVLAIYMGNRPEMITVPNLIGRTMDEVSQEMSQQNISLIVMFEEYRDDYDKGVIIYQTYLEGAVIESGSRIEVVVSSGRRMVEVPDLTGLIINDAISILTGLGLHHEENYEYIDSVDILRIIRQDPVGDSQLEVGGTVVLHISQGVELETVIAPSLIGLGESAAIATIERSGMTLGDISRMESLTVEAGHVITQSVNFGREVSRGSIMGIIVSSGLPTAIEDTDEINDTNGTNEINEINELDEVNQVAIPDQLDQDTTTVDTAQNTVQEPEEPEPVPSPEPEPEPVQEPSHQLVPSTRILHIDPVFVDGVESVTVRVNQRIATGFTTIHEREYAVSEFPISIQVTGVGRVDYQMYIDDRHVATESIDFSM